MRQESFPVNKLKLKGLMGIFRGKKKRFSESSERFVYVNFSMTRLQLIWILPKLLYGMGAAEEFQASVAAITWGENHDLDKLLETMGIRHLVLELEDRRSFWAACKAMCRTVWFVLRDGSGSGLQDLRVMNLPVGRAIYEDILRTSELSTIRSARNIICIKKIFHILWMLYSLDKYLKKNPPVFCVMDDIAYHEGILAALFRKHGARLYSMNIVGDGEVWLDDKMCTVRWGERRNIVLKEIMDQIGNEAVPEAEQMLSDRFQGKNGRDIDRGAFAGKEVITRVEAMKKLGLTEGKKNAVIMAHTFTDAIYNYGTICYRDYYDWIENTLKIASETEQVNWILKPHPTRKAYHESKDSIEALFAKYKKKHMYFLSDDVSAESVKNIADVIITVGGNAGAEFSCFGIPVVILGKPYYCGLGYTIEPKEREEYESILRRIDQIPGLSEDQIRTAKKAFYRNSKPLGVTEYFDDELFRLFRKQDKRMSDEYALQVFSGDKGTERYNDDMMEELVHYFEQHEFEDCEYYQRGKMRARQK